MGCKNISSNSSKRKGEKVKEETTEVITQGGKKTKITKQVIETTQPDGTVITRTVIQKTTGDDTNNKPASKRNEEFSSRDNKNEKIDTNAFVNEALQNHNQYRSKHGVAPLKLNSDLTKVAQNYAEKISKTGTLEHSNNKFKGEDIGENLYMVGGFKLTGKKMTDDWYAEMKDYNFSKGKFSPNTGHFTQLIWAGSTQVGFGIAQGKDGEYFGVANYYPAGNYEGEFMENVMKIGQSKPSVAVVPVKPNNNKVSKDSSSDSDDDDQNQFTKEALQCHNQFRSKHKAPVLKINSELNKIAQKYAEKLAKNNSFEHSSNKYKGENLGENLFMCGGTKITGKDMTQAWYDEIKQYDFRAATFSSGTGHFTQVVWIGSTEVGFGSAKAKNGTYIGVANYYPAGNFMGDFAANVKKA